MKESIKTLLDSYQIRKTKKDKQAFLLWLKAHCEKHNYELTEDSYSKNGKNLIVGDVESAELVLTAHYDTPPNFFIPMVMFFSNWASFLLSQALVIPPVFLLVFLSTYISTFLANEFSLLSLMLPSIIMILYMLQITIGFSNKNNANDNTSGVATLISVLEDMPPNIREKVCVVFFDQEELGLVGSSNFNKKYRETMKTKALINFDCVAVGDTLNFITNKALRASKYEGILETAAKKITAGSDKNIRFGKALWNIYMSDQLHFPMTAGVVAAKKMPVLGYYLSKIHSKWDTEFDYENITLLSQIAIETAKNL